ncbi:MAG: TIGR03986 family CRISPR-associated RAMP protein [Acidobacteria bacterium]|nr:TIGR03986 family CRISPR-associated RAMP protein [Acidobacteriota bacterium]
MKEQTVRLPNQATRIDEDRRALAPYNFVELPYSVATVIEGCKLSPAPKAEPSQGRAAWEKARDEALAERTAEATKYLPDQSSFHSMRHSGWIDCLLTTESPAYVRAPLTPEQRKAKKYAKDLSAFFYEWEEGQPVIPGSTLRGMLRSLVEIAGYGKITEVSKKRLIYRAVGDTTNHGEEYRKLLMDDQTSKFARGNRNEKFYVPLMLGGYMRKRDSDWYIQPAEERQGTTFARIRIDERLFDALTPLPGCRNAYEIYVRVGDYAFQPVRGGFLNIRAARVLDSSDRPGPGLFKATLARSGYMFSKRSEAVIYPANEKAEWLPLDDDKIEDYRNQLSAEQQKLLGKRGVLQEGQPVFYTVERDEQGRVKVDFFGHCRMLRLPYKHSPEKFVPEQLRHPADIDLAEAIFGFTKQLPDDQHCPKERRYAGRVRVGSARLVEPEKQGNIWLSPNRPVTPRVLGTPKPTTFQHYLVQTKPNPEQNDERTRDGRPKYELKLADYAALRPGDSQDKLKPLTTLRGHKLYWHKGAVSLNDIQLEKQPKGEVTTQIHPVRAGVQFQFRLRFDNLSDYELGALLWVLRLGADEKHRLKLGMGKPLGMGAVKLAPILHLIDRAQRYSRLFDGDTWASGEQSAIAEEEEKALRAFEKFVLDHNVQANVTRFEELARIKQLRALLEWPGPDPARTRYLEIERYDANSRRGKRNEYDGRPVLPRPLAVLDVEDAAPAPPTTFNTLRTSLPAEFSWGIVTKWGLGSSASYGFIQPEGGGAQVFVHLSVTPNGNTPLKPGERVMFTARREARGMVATEVRLAR